MVQTVGNVDRTLFLAAVPSLTCCWEDPGQMLRTEWYCHQTVHTVVQHHMKGVKRGLFVQCGCSFSSIDLVSLDLNLYSMIIFMWKSCGPNLRHYLWLVSYPNYIVLVPIVWNHFFLRARKCGLETRLTLGLSTAHVWICMALISTSAWIIWRVWRPIASAHNPKIVSTVCWETHGWLLWEANCTFPQEAGIAILTTWWLPIQHALAARSATWN